MAVPEGVMTFRPHYYIHEGELKSPVEEPTGYIPGGHISRDNLVPLLIANFMFSGGRPEIQLVHFRWEGANNGFDYLMTLYNIAHVGLDHLSEREKAMLRNAARRVSKHKEESERDPNMDLISDEGIISGIWGQLFGVLMMDQGKGMLPKAPEVFSDEELTGMSFRELRAKVREYLVAVKKLG